jgi:hypothetical protein
MSIVLNLLNEFVLGGTDYGIDPRTKTRLVPAVKHPKTGRLYIGGRGEDHRDILDKYNLLADKDIGSGREKSGAWSPAIHTGYYDHVTKQYFTHKEAGFHATDLMTGPQRFRKYGSESCGG